ncbi:MAG TPA: lipopolysaccharide biosynthesis protein [Allosphingosinicella sp.]|jgi:O-antigen/teichoic acid export membrane protein|nr:lipopolysaccharide biosynthesis protein [Allosphingosinicella sp.]
MRAGKSAERLILGGARATAFGFAIRFGARIAFLFAAARLFGLALFGAYSLAVAAVELAVTIGGLGFKRILFKRLEEEGGDRPHIHIVLDAALLVAVVSLALAGLFVVAVAAAPAGFISPNVAIALVILAPMIAGQALLDLFLAATRWTHIIRYEVLSRSVIEPYGGLAAILAVWSLGYGASGLLIGYWAGTLAALAYALMGARRRLGAFDLTAYRFARSRILPLLRDSAGATLSDVLNGLFARVDRWLVGIFLGESPAGIYGMARQIRIPVRQVRQNFDGLLNPVIARTLALKGPRETGVASASAARLILAVQLPILIALAFGGIPLLAWFGNEFVTGYWALLLLAAAEMIQGAFGVSDLIILYRRPLAQLGITATNIAVNLIAGWLLIGPLGVTGAGLSVLAGVGAGALLRRVALRAYFGVSVKLHYSAGPIAAAALAFAAAFGVEALLDTASPALLYGAGLAAGLITYAIMLKLWLLATGDALSLQDFQIETDCPDAERPPNP